MVVVENPAVHTEKIESEKIRVISTRCTVYHKLTLLGVEAPREKVDKRFTRLEKKKKKKNGRNKYK